MSNSLSARYKPIHTHITRSSNFSCWLEISLGSLWLEEYINRGALCSFSLDQRPAWKAERLDQIEMASLQKFDEQYHHHHRLHRCQKASPKRTGPAAQWWATGESWPSILQYWSVSPNWLALKLLQIHGLSAALLEPAGWFPEFFYFFIFFDLSKIYT